MSITVVPIQHSGLSVQPVSVYYPRCQVPGSPVLFLHGMYMGVDSAVVRAWIEGLSGSHQVIAVDALGHGKSDRPHDPALYSPEATVARLCSLMDTVSSGPVHCVGYSMGGWHGFAMASHAHRYLRSLSAIAMHPYARNPGALDAQVAWLSRGIESVVADIESDIGELPPNERELFLRNDVDALIAQSRSVVDSPGFGNMLPVASLPILLVDGSDDPFCTGAARAAADMPGLQFVELPGVDHVHSGLWDVTGQIVVEFISRVEAG